MSMRRFTHLQIVGRNELRRFVRRESLIVLRVSRVVYAVFGTHECAVDGNAIAHGIFRDQLEEEI